MHSLRTKLTAMIVATILVSVFLSGLTSILAIKREGDKSSAEMMALLCDNCRLSINDYLVSIEKSVDMVSLFAADELDGIRLAEGGVIGSNGLSGKLLIGDSDQERQAALDRYLSSYTEKVEVLCRSVAGRTNGVISFYYRISPEISEASNGFLYTSGKSGAFRRSKLTDLSLYEEFDTEHVGWYYIPMQRGYASWLSPYYNENLGVKMVSYATPVYKSGTFIGVIGMDISYDTLVDQIRDIRVYDTGYAFLTEADGVIVYHPELETGVNQIREDPTLQKSYEELSRLERSTEPVRYQMNGTYRQMFFTTLSNGMKLVVTAPVSEINAVWRSLITRIFLAAAVLMAVFIVITLFAVNRLTKPLQNLTAASKELALGNFNVNLDYNGQDEIGILTETFRKLVAHLQVYIGDLNSKAYRDGLTGTRNKAAYNLAARKLDDEIAEAAGSGTELRFGVMMLDVNNLKTINDTHGHEKGDAYLRKSCTLICKVFKHCPVFRVGGDEFIVILREESYDRREELLRLFDERMAEINAEAKEPWDRADIAKGLAVYDPERDKLSEDVLKRADVLMYENKKMIKAKRGEVPR